MGSVKPLKDSVHAECTGLPDRGSVISCSESPLKDYGIKLNVTTPVTFTGSPIRNVGWNLA